jgi:hypothetical protein
VLHDLHESVAYLYDNTVANPVTRPDWGFACLDEGHGRTVLFDTGTKPLVLQHNLQALRIIYQLPVKIVVFNNGGIGPGHAKHPDKPLQNMRPNALIYGARYDKIG